MSHVISFYYISCRFKLNQFTHFVISKMCVNDDANRIGMEKNRFHKREKFSNVILTQEYFNRSSIINNNDRVLIFFLLP